MNSYADPNFVGTIALKYSHSDFKSNFELPIVIIIMVCIRAYCDHDFSRELLNINYIEQSSLFF